VAEEKGHFGNLEDKGTSAVEAVTTGLMKIQLIKNFALMYQF
jgi:hypothetical protein